MICPCERPVLARPHFKFHFNLRHSPHARPPTARPAQRPSLTTGDVVDPSRPCSGTLLVVLDGLLVLLQPPGQSPPCPLTAIRSALSPSATVCTSSANSEPFRSDRTVRTAFYLPPTIALGLVHSTLPLRIGTSIFRCSPRSSPFHSSQASISRASVQHCSHQSQRLPFTRSFLASSGWLFYVTLV